MYWRRSKFEGEYSKFARDIQAIERNPLVKKVRVIVRFVIPFKVIV